MSYETQTNAKLTTASDTEERRRKRKRKKTKVQHMMQPPPLPLPPPRALAVLHSKGGRVGAGVRGPAQPAQACGKGVWQEGEMALLGLLG